MEQLGIIKEIRAKYNSHKFEKVISLFNQYLNIPNAGIYDELLDIYTSSLIKLGYLEEAKKNVELMKSMFPYYYDNRGLALKYIACDMEEELKELLQRQKFEGKDYYVFGKNCFYNGQYYMANILFDMASRSETVSNKNLHDYIRRIKIYESNPEVFKALSYYKFKSLGNQLEPGYAIRTSIVRDKYGCNKDNDDPMKSQRPYLIWKIIDNLIYAFPLASKIRGNYLDGHILSSGKYLNYPYDRRLKDKLVCIKENDVEFVDDKIDEEDFKLAIESMYNICCYNQIIPRNQIRRFMTVMAQEIGVEPNDVITVNDNEEKTTYFVLDRNDDKKVYEVIRVEKDDCGDIYLTPDEAIEIAMTSRIVDVQRLTFYQREPLFEQFKNTPYAQKVLNKKI